MCDVRYKVWLSVSGDLVGKCCRYEFDGSDVQIPSKRRYIAGSQHRCGGMPEMSMVNRLLGASMRELLLATATRASLRVMCSV